MFRLMFIVLCFLVGSAQAEGIPEYNPATQYLSCYVENLGASEKVAYKVCDLEIRKEAIAADVLSSRRFWLVTRSKETAWWGRANPDFLRQRVVSTATIMRNGAVPDDFSPNLWVTSANALELIAVSNEYVEITDRASAPETALGHYDEELCYALLLSVALMPDEKTGVPTNPAVRRLFQGFGFEMKLLPITQKEWDLFNREYGWARKQ